MTENIISWNFANWITVVLMALIGYVIFSMVVSIVTRKGEEKNA